MQLLQPPHELVSAAAERRPGAEEALLSSCHACYALSRNASLSVLVDAVGNDQLSHFLTAAAQLTMGCIGAGGVSVDVATEWQGQATGASRWITSASKTWSSES